MPHAKAQRREEEEGRGRDVVAGSWDTGPVWSSFADTRGDCYGGRVIMGGAEEGTTKDTKKMEEMEEAEGMEEVKDMNGM
jgi:hypothetical protein